MKIQCDVCEKEEASVFCVADEAALCSACDHRVHHANKLAGKHQRFSLHHPSPKQAPLCDICKERRAFLFCQQDRAILCRECDFPIHNANEHTQKHTRFLLTGVKLSATSVLYSDSADAVPTITKTPQQSAAAAPESSCDRSNTLPHQCISDYLMDTLPGWHVEDFLDSSSPSPPQGFYKNGENDMMLPLWEDEIGSNMSTGFPAEKMGVWVPQAPPTLNYQTQSKSSFDHHQYTADLGFGTSNSGNNNNNNNNYLKTSSRNWSEDSSFIVPQISPSLNTASKRSRTFW
ncbi:hypothetical protein ABFS83_03G072000 [Erythranthe nasuta]